MKIFWLVRLFLTLASTWLLLPTAPAQTSDRFYYWASPYPTDRIANPESFVIEVDAAQKARIEEIRDRRFDVQFDGQIASGSVAYNKNYYAPGNPAWNWHFASITRFYERRADQFIFGPPETAANRESNPSDIAANPEQWIARHGPYYYPTKYFVNRQIDPSKRDAVANVSNRGMTGAGEKALITGVIITGGEPRNIVVRALGPSMAAAGVQQPALNPKIEVFSLSGRRIAANADWRSDTRANTLSEAYPALAPTNEKEAAILLTLLPGAYTLHGLNEDGTEGVVLLEAYDVDSKNE